MEILLMSDNSKKSGLRWPSANGAMGLGFSSFKASDPVGFHHFFFGPQNCGSLCVCMSLTDQCNESK